MSDSGADWLPGCRKALEHPLRQVLFTLLRHRPATAAELQPAVARPLKTVNYHLGVLARRECILVEAVGATTIYRVDPRSASLLAAKETLSEPGRIVMLSLLDAAWTAIAESPEGTSPVPRWETLQLDEPGLRDASAVIAEALEEIKVISAGSQERRAAGTGHRLHTLVIAASLFDPPPGRAGT